MQSLVATRSSALKQTVRGFASSAARAQATPLQKPVINKEFKIYRWVCRSSSLSPLAQNKMLSAVWSM